MLGHARDMFGGFDPKARYADGGRVGMASGGRPEQRKSIVGLPDQYSPGHNALLAAVRNGQSRPYEERALSEGDRLLTGVLARPADAAPRLIYADWLDEHGQDAAALGLRSGTVPPTTLLSTGAIQAHPTDIATRALAQFSMTQRDPLWRIYQRAAQQTKLTGNYRAMGRFLGTVDTDLPAHGAEFHHGQSGFVRARSWDFLAGQEPEDLPGRHYLASVRDVFDPSVTGGSVTTEAFMSGREVSRILSRLKLTGGQADSIAEFRHRYKLASGGPVSGPEGHDVIPASLTRGEYVIKKESAQRIGYDTLDKMNRQGYALGGRVGFAFGGKVPKKDQPLTPEENQHILDLLERKPEFFQALAESLSRKNPGLRRQGLDVTDIEELAFGQSAVNAARGFDPSKGVPLEALITKYARRDAYKLSNRRQPLVGEQSVEGHGVAARGPSPLESLVSAEDLARVEKAVGGPINLGLNKEGEFNYADLKATAKQMGLKVGTPKAEDLKKIVIEEIRRRIGEATPTPQEVVRAAETLPARGRQDVAQAVAAQSLARPTAVPPYPTPYDAPAAYAGVANYPRIQVRSAPRPGGAPPGGFDPAFLAAIGMTPGTLANVPGLPFGGYGNRGGQEAIGYTRPTVIPGQYTPPGQLAIGYTPPAVPGQNPNDPSVLAFQARQRAEADRQAAEAARRKFGLGGPDVSYESLLAQRARGAAGATGIPAGAFTSFAQGKLDNELLRNVHAQVRGAGTDRRTADAVTAELVSQIQGGQRPVSVGANGQGYDAGLAALLAGRGQDPRGKVGALQRFFPRLSPETAGKLQLSLGFAAPAIASFGADRLRDTREPEVVAKLGEGDQRGFVNRSAAASGLQLGIAGAVAGSAFSLPGALIGGGAGFLVGFVSAIKESEQEIRRAKIGNALSDLGDRIRDIAAGRTGFDGAAAAQGVASIREARTSLFEKAHADATGTFGGFNAAAFGAQYKTDFRKQFGPNVGDYNAALNRFAEDLGKSGTAAGKSIDDFAKEIQQGGGGLNKSLLEVISQLRGSGVAEEAGRYAKLAVETRDAEARKKAGEDTRLAADRATHAFGRLADSVEQAGKVFEKFEELSQKLSGRVGGEAGLSRITPDDGLDFRNLDRAAFARSANQVGAGLGPEGLALSRSAVAANQIQSVSGGVLARALSEGPLDAADLTTRYRRGVRASLGEGAGGPEFERALEAAASALQTKTLAEVQKAVGAGTSDKLVDEITAPLESIKKATEAIAQQARAGANATLSGYGQFFSLQRRRDETLGVQDTATQGLARALAEQRAGAAGRPVDVLKDLNPADLDLAYTSRQRRLSRGGFGGGAVGAALGEAFAFDPKQLGEKLRSTYDAIDQAEKNLEDLFGRTQGRGNEYDEAAKAVQSSGTRPGNCTRPSRI
jgi:uncharacterized protein (TIGR02996 family)